MTSLIFKRLKKPDFFMIKKMYLNPYYQVIQKNDILYDSHLSTDITFIKKENALGG